MITNKNIWVVESNNDIHIDRDFKLKATKKNVEYSVIIIAL